MKKRRWTKAQKQLIGLYRLCTIGIFVTFLSLGCFLGLLWFVRPSKSDVEKRELAKYPNFTLASFVDGSYFSDVSTWYSDTYPLRDQFIALNHSFQQLYGIQSGEIMVGNVEQGDEIPTEKKETAPKEKKEAVLPDSTQLESEVADRIMMGLYVENGAAYGAYSFSQAAADAYINALDEAGEKLDGITNVYSLLVANNSGVVLDDATCAKLGGSNQQQAIEYYNHSFSDKVTPIEYFDDLKAHKDEYLYFRTDHHWTQQGAYYAYKEFAKLKGFKAEKLSDLNEYVFSPFLGTYYSELQLDSMAANPDTVYAYAPKSTNDMQYMDENGNMVDWRIIQDVSDWTESSGYYCFIGGDKPYAIMDNPDIEDGTSCLVIKESYGNCFIPFLVDHYDKVYYMDFRSAAYNAVDFCKEHKVTDLIVENNIQIIGSEDVVETIKSIL